MRSAAVQCDGQELQWVFADEGILQSVQASSASRSQKGVERAGAVAACCQWLQEQHAEGVLAEHSRDDHEGLNVNPASLEDSNSARDQIASEHEHEPGLWRPILEPHEKGQELHVARPAKDKKDAAAAQPLLWRELALLLMLQVAALEHVVRGEGGAAVARSPSTSPLKHATPSTGKPSRVQQGNAGSPLYRQGSNASSLSQSAADAGAGELPSTPKAFIPEENKQQQQWQTALCRLPYVDSATVSAGDNKALQSLMQQLKVCHRGASCCFFGVIQKPAPLHGCISLLALLLLLKRRDKSLCRCILDCAMVDSCAEGVGAEAGSAGRRACMSKDTLLLLQGGPTSLWS